MSIWYEIKDPEDVKLSQDGKTIEVNFTGDDNGNMYVEIPVKFIHIPTNEPALFAKWAARNYQKLLGDGGIWLETQSHKKYSTAELYEIYKSNK